METNIKQEVSSFYKYLKDKLGLKSSYKFIFIKDPQNLAKGIIGYTAYFNPDDNTVSIYVDGRDIKDILKSIAHEFVHARQNENGLLAGSDMSDGYAQNDPKLREMEEEAYKLGGILFRDYQDMKRKEGNKMENDKKEEEQPKTDREFLQEVNEAQSFVDWAREQRNMLTAKNMENTFNLKDWGNKK